MIRTYVTKGIIKEKMYNFQHILIRFKQAFVTITKNVTKNDYQEIYFRKIVTNL